MKKLQKGSLNFQRVAFQQRVLKGKSMKRLSKQALERSTRKNNNNDLSDGENEDECESTAVEEEGTIDDVRFSQEEEDDGEVFPPRGILRTTQGNPLLNQRHLELQTDYSSSDVIDQGISQQPCCSKSLPPPHNLYEEKEHARATICPPELNKEEHSTPSGKAASSKSTANTNSIGRKRKTSYPSTNVEKRIKTTATSAPPSATNKQKVTFLDGSHPPASVETISSKCGAIEEYLGTSGGFLNGRFFRLSRTTSQNNNEQYSSGFVSSGRQNAPSARSTSISSRMFGYANFFLTLCLNLTAKLLFFNLFIDNLAFCLR